MSDEGNIKCYVDIGISCKQRVNFQDVYTGELKTIAKRAIISANKISVPCG